MPESKTPKLTKQQKEAMANAMAGFFFDFWQRQEIKGNQVAAAGSGLSRRGGFPDNATAS
jgi:hypothetical protein